jgi:hypothetical protein
VFVATTFLLIETTGMRVHPLALDADLGGVEELGLPAGPAEGEDEHEGGASRGYAVAQHSFEQLPSLSLRGSQGSHSVPS